MSAGNMNNKLWLQNSLWAMEYGKEAIRAGILINGGSAVALLAFLSSSRSPDPASMMPSLKCFVLGVLCAAVTAMLAYITQSLFALVNKTGRKLFETFAYWFLAAGIVTISASLILYVWGAWIAASAIMRFTGAGG